MADTKPKSSPKKHSGLVLLLRDIGVAGGLVALVLLAMFTYAGQWPPLVVVESSSMMHGDENLSHVGTIDTGDLVLVQMVDRIDDIVTYVEGFTSGHRTYGDFGDVIVYKADGSETATPIIHRAMIYLEANPDGMSYKAEALQNLPPGKWSCSNPLATWDNLTGTIYILDVGYSGQTVTISLQDLPRSVGNGYITKGDHNPTIDQPFRSAQVPLSWVVGKARGEIPWFGLLKLWSTHTLRGVAPENSVRNLWISIAAIVIAPILVDITLTYREKKRIAMKKEERSANRMRKEREKDGG